MGYDISRIRRGELPNEVITIQNQEGNEGVNLQLDITKTSTGQTTKIDLYDSLQKEETEAIILAIDEDDDNIITSEEINKFANRDGMPLEEIAIESIVTEALNLFETDDENTDEADNTKETDEAIQTDNQAGTQNSLPSTVTVDAWGAGSNDCLDHIMKNYYQSITPYSDEWFELETKIMDANPEICGGVDADGNEITGRTRIFDGSRHNSVIHAGDIIKLPELTTTVTGSSEADNSSDAGSSEASNEYDYPISDELLAFSGLELSEEELNSLQTGNENATLADGRHVGVLADDHFQILQSNDDGTTYTEEYKRDPDTGNFIAEKWIYDPSTGQTRDKTRTEYDADGNAMLNETDTKLFSAAGLELSNEEYQALLENEDNDITKDDGTKITMNGENSFTIKYPDGNKIANLYVKSDGYHIDTKEYLGSSMKTTQAVMDENGRMIQKTEWGYYDDELRKNNKPSQKTEYIFDENGNEIGCKTYDENGILCIERTSEGYMNFYNPDGTMRDTTNPSLTNVVATNKKVAQYTENLNASGWSNSISTDLMNDGNITCASAKTIFDNTTTGHTMENFHYSGMYNTSTAQAQINALANMIKRSNAEETAEFLTAYPYVVGIQDNLSYGKETESLKTYFGALDSALKNSDITLDTTSEHIQNIVLNKQSAGNYFKPILDDYANGVLTPQEALGAFYNKYGDTDSMIYALRNYLGNGDQEKYGPLLEQLFCQVLSGN